MCVCGMSVSASAHWSVQNTYWSICLELLAASIFRFCTFSMARANEMQSACSRRLCLYCFVGRWARERERKRDVHCAPTSNKTKQRQQKTEDKTKRLLLYEQLKQSRQGTFPSYGFSLASHRVRTIFTIVCFSWPCTPISAAVQWYRKNAFTETQKYSQTHTHGHAHTHTFIADAVNAVAQRKTIDYTHACMRYYSVVCALPSSLCKNDVRQFTCSSQRMVCAIPWCIRCLPLYSAHEYIWRSLWRAFISFYVWISLKILLSFSPATQRCSLTPTPDRRPIAKQKQNFRTIPISKWHIVSKLSKLLVPLNDWLRQMAARQSSSNGGGSKTKPTKSPSNIARMYYYWVINWANDPWEYRCARVQGCHFVNTFTNTN